MSHGVRSDRGSSRRSSTTSDFSESDFKRLEELREIGKSAKREARDLDIESMPDSMMSSASTALTKAERKRQLAIAKTHKLILTKKPREILKEEEYLSDMDKLITRDFFPHYDHVKDQHDYLIAEEEGDVEAMREIQMKHKKRQAERPTTGAWTVGGTPFLEVTLSEKVNQKLTVFRVHRHQMIARLIAKKTTKMTQTRSKRKKKLQLRKNREQKTSPSTDTAPSSHPKTTTHFKKFTNSQKTRKKSNMRFYMLRRSKETGCVKTRMPINLWVRLSVYAKSL